MKKIICSLILIGGLSSFANAQTGAPLIDLVWEADAYVPAEYQGKPLASPGVNIKVTALANQSNLEYWWGLDDYELPDYSGRGKNSFNFRATKAAGNTHLVRLIVKSGNQNVASQSLAIPVVSPILAFYEQEPLLGETFNRAVSGNFTLPKSEITFVAEPFFFNRDTVNNLRYAWKLNGQPVSADGGNGRVITFTTPTSGGQGTNEIKLLAENPQSPLQYAQNSFSIIFNSSANNESLF